MNSKVIVRLSGNGSVLPTNTGPSILTGDDDSMRVSVRVANGVLVPSPNAIAVIPSTGGSLKYLDELLDVDTADPEDDAALFYDANSRQWVARKITTSDVVLPEDDVIDGGSF